MKFNQDSAKRRFHLFMEEIHKAQEKSFVGKVLIADKGYGGFLGTVFFSAQQSCCFLMGNDYNRRAVELLLWPYRRQRDEQEVEIDFFWEPELVDGNDKKRKSYFLSFEHFLKEIHKGHDELSHLFPMIPSQDFKWTVARDKVEAEEKFLSPLSQEMINLVRKGYSLFDLLDGLPHYPRAHILSALAHLNRQRIVLRKS